MLKGQIGRLKEGNRKLKEGKRLRKGQIRNLKEQSDLQRHSEKLV